MKLFNLTFITFFVLLLCNSSTAKDYKGAEYRTKNSFLYGRFEVRMKSAHRDGMLSSFFTYYDGGGGINNWNEIDLEIMGRYSDDIQFNTITPGQVNHVGHYPMVNSPNTNYHVYAFEWTPEYVSWFVNGEEVLKQTGEHIQTLFRAQKIMMNVWNPIYENWAGVFNPEALPAFAFYDWVSYYNYTPGSGNYGTENNFTHSWTDNFDSWDTNRWDKATHTWDGNGCDFIHANAVFQDGKLILCLTDNINIGYVDVKAPVLMWARASENKVLAMFTEELDETSSQNISNYFISDVTINSAVLQSDLKSVELSVTGLELTSTKNLIALNIKDRANPANTMSAKATSIIMPQPLSFPVKINCGGPAALNYLADQQFAQNVEYGHYDGSSTAFGATLQINGTDEDEIYRYEEYGMVAYRVRVLNGNYNMKLMFAENYFNSSGSRVFDIYVENQRVIEDLDIYSLVGKNTAYELQLTNITVTDEIINIHFAAKIDNPVINGIVIESNTTGIMEDSENENKSFYLEQNFPNPFNGQTTIRYEINKAEKIQLRIYDLLGSQIFFKDMGFLQPGNYEFYLDTKKSFSSPLCSGVYFYSVQGSTFTETKKLILLN